MPIYEANGERYNLPDDVVSEFVKDFPGARLVEEPKKEEPKVEQPQVEDPYVSMGAYRPSFAPKVEATPVPLRPEGRSDRIQREEEERDAFSRAGANISLELGRVPFHRVDADAVAERLKQSREAADEVTFGFREQPFTDKSRAERAAKQRMQNVKAQDDARDYIAETMGINKDDITDIGEYTQEGGEYYADFSRAEEKRMNKELNDALTKQGDALYQQVGASLQEKMNKINPYKDITENFLRGVGTTQWGAPQNRSSYMPGIDDEQTAVAYAAARALSLAKGMQEAAHDDGMWGNFWEGALSGLTEAGENMTDAKKMNDAIATVVKKWEEGGETTKLLNDDEKMLLDALAYQTAVASMYQDKISSSYNVGSTVGAMLPFAVEFLVNPASGLGRKAASQFGKYALKRFAKNTANKYARSAIYNTGRGLGRIGGSVAGGAAMTATTGLPKTVLGVQERMLGRPDVNYADGKPVYAGQIKREEFLPAVKKEVAKQMLEYGSEMLGAGYLDDMFTAARKLTKGTKGLGWIDRIVSGPRAKAVKSFMERTGWNGPIEEFLEEVHVGYLEPYLVGDNTHEDFFNKDNLIEVALGVAIPGAVISTAKTVAGAADGSFRAGAQERWKMEHADRRATELWGNWAEWKDLRNSLMVSQPEEIEAKLKEIANSTRLTDNQKMAAIDFGIYSLQYRTARGVADAMTDGRRKEINSMLHELYYSREAYKEQGYSQEPTGVNSIVALTEYEAAENEVRRVLGLAPDDDIENVVAQMGELNDDVADALEDYRRKKAVFDGLKQKFRDTVTKQYAEAENSIDRMVNKDNPSMVYSTMLDGQMVYITGGNVVLREDNTIDIDQSSDLYVTYPNNQVKPVSANRFASPVKVESAEALKAARKAEIDAQWQSEFDSAEISAEEQQKREKGLLFSMTDKDGQHTIEIVSEGEDMSKVLIDGNPTEIPTTLLNKFREEAGVVPSKEAAEVVAPSTVETEMPEAVPVVNEVAPIPTEKVGKEERAAYHLVPIERTMEDLHDGLLNQNEVQALINARIKEAQDEVQALEKKKPTEPKNPVMGASKEAYLAAKAKAQEEFAKVKAQWDADMQAAQQKLSYYNELNAREQEITRSDIGEAYANVQPVEVVETTPDEFIANHMPKITPESFKRETGLSNSEQSELVGYISSKKKGGVTIEQAAEGIMENYGDELRGLGFNGDVQDVRDMIIGILSNGNPRSYAKKGLDQRKQASIDQQRAEMETVAASLGFESVEDMQAYEEQVIPGIIQMYTGFDYNEYYNNLAENYKYDTTRESEAVGRGGELLQGEQSIDNTGTPVAEGNEGGTVPSGVPSNGADAQTPGNEQVTAPVGEITPTAEEVADAQAFADASAQNTVEAYQDYLDNHPEGAYHDGARAGMWMIEGINPETHGRNVVARNAANAVLARVEAPQATNKMQEAELTPAVEPVGNSEQEKPTQKFGYRVGQKVYLPRRGSIRQAEILEFGDSYIRVRYENIDGETITMNFAAEYFEKLKKQAEAMMETDLENVEKGQKAVEPLEETDSSTLSQTSDQVGEQVAEGVGGTEIGKQSLAEKVVATAKKKQQARFADHAKGIAEKLGVEVTVHNDESTVTNKDAMTAISEGGEVKGWYNSTTGEIALFLPAMESMRDVESTILHEAVAHYGIKHFLGKEDFDKFLDSVWNMMPTALRAHYLQYVGADMKNPSQEKMRQAADEYVAHIAEKMDLNELEKNVWNKLIDLILDALRKIGFKNLGRKDIENVIKASYRNLRQNGGNSQVTGQGETMASKKSRMRPRRELLNTDLTEEEKSDIQKYIQKLSREIDDSHPLLFVKNNYIYTFNTDLELYDENRQDGDGFEILYKDDLNKLTYDQKYDIQRSLKNNPQIADRIIEQFGLLRSGNILSILLSPGTNTAIPDAGVDGSTNEEAISKRTRDIGESAFDESGEVNPQDSESGIRFRKVTPEMDAEYMTAVENGDMETAERLVKEAAKLAMPDTKVVDEDGYPMVVYHGSEEDFNVFDKTKGRANMDIQGMFFSPWDDDARGYGSNVRAFFLNITKPANESTGYKALNKFQGQNGAGIKAREYLVSAGYDGVNNEDQEFVAFDPNQIKSADAVTYDDNGNVIPLSERFNEEKEDIRFRRANKNQDVFVSNAQRAVEGIKQEKATPEQWIAMLKKNGGLKAGEEAWLGLETWLNEKQGVVTKQEILDFIGENKIQIEEVRYDDAIDRLTDHDIYETEEFTNLNSSLIEYDEDEYPYINREEYERLRHEDPDFIDGFSMDYWGEGLEVNDPNAAARYLGLTGGSNPINYTRLDYTTDGLDNKREIALTVPTIEPYNASDEIHFGDAGNGRAVAWVRFGETTAYETIKDFNEVTEFHEPYKNRVGHDIYKPVGGFRSGDYIAHGKAKTGEMIYVVYINDKQIPVAHATLEEARNAMNEYYREHPRELKKPVRVLVIDEIQSKRHQDGREKGYFDARGKRKEIARLENELDDLRDRSSFVRRGLRAKYGDEWLTVESWTDENGLLRERVVPDSNILSVEEYEEITGLQDKIKETDNKIWEIKKDYDYAHVPSAPFEKNWHELAMKRMLRLAAEEGFDKVAWTTGEQQAERYNLGSTVDGIDVAPYEAQSPNEIDGYDVSIRTSNYGERIELFADKNGTITSGEFNGESLEGKPLSDVVGKEIATKIVSSEEATTISGDGLRVGGEGMKGFYDRMLPSFVQKYTKKWGAKVGEVTMPNLSENNTMHSVDVTPEMQESVMEGQTMFRRGERNKALNELRENLDEERAKLPTFEQQRAKQAVLELIQPFAKEKREEYADELITKMRENAELHVPRLLTEEVWKNEIEGKTFQSPVGPVKLGENQFDKNKGKGREKEFGMIIPTLERPDLIFEEFDTEDDAERQTKYVFAKAFYDSEGNKHVYYADVSVLKNGMEAVTSSHHLRPNQLRKKIKEEHLLWNRFASDSPSSAQGSSTDQNNAPSADKGSISSAEMQEGETLFSKKKLTPEQKKKQEALKENAKAIRRLHNVKANHSLTALRNLGFALETQEQRDEHDRLFAERDAISGRQNAVSAEVNPQSMTLMERITESLMKHAEKNRENIEMRLSAIRAYGRDLSNVLKLMRAQRGYDRNTVRMFTNLVKMYLRNNSMSGMSSYDITRLLGLIERANGGYGPQVMRAAEQIAEIITKSHTRELENIVRKQIKTGAEKVNASGVVVQGGVDIIGKRVLNTFRDAINMTTEEEFEKAYKEAFERAHKFPNDAEAKAVCDAMVIAKEYRDNIADRKAQEKELQKSIGYYSDIRQKLENGEISRKGYGEFVDSVRRSIVELRAQMVDDYQKIIHALGGDITEGIARAKAFRERELARIESIRNMADADMEGVSKSAERKKRGKMGKSVDYITYKNPLLRLIMTGMGTYNEFMKFFGRNAVGGKGRLYDYFIGRYTEAQNQEWKGKQADIKKMDDTCEEIFGKDFISVMRDSTKNSGVVLEYWNGGERVSRELSIGQLMYIYMTAKQTDGEMKLRGMGITEETVNRAVSVLPATYKAYADWVQSEFLPEMRPRMNKVHQRMFGASMSEVENYFPLVVNTDARQSEVDLNSVMPITPSTITGAVIKRKVNATPLDLEANAFDVLMNHVNDMEHWAAFAEFTRDNNTLISDKDFMNRVKNSKDLRYGDGEMIWNDFVDCARITTGNYQSKKDYMSNIMKGTNSAKITFGYYTALKQFLSAPGLLTDASWRSVIKATANPMGSWKWAIENLPGFEERWKGRTAGNERLADSDNDWSIWDNRVVKAARELGMSPNAFVDAVVVSTGARAVYETRKKLYKSLGLPDADAHKRAQTDAAVAYNETQQSAQGAYLSILQKEGGFYAMVMTLFRNSQMAYGRKVTGSMAEIVKKISRWNDILENEEKKYKDMGLSEEDAHKAANREMLQSTKKDVINLVLFGYVLNAIWALGEYIPYLIFGDDEEEKEKIMGDILKIGATGMFEGFALGGFAKDLYIQGVTDSKYSVDMITTPFAEDFEKVYNRFKNDGTLAGLTQLLVLGAETTTGISPQRLIDDAAALIDFCNGNLDTATEVQLLALRLAKVPQSQIDKIYMDEAIDGDVMKLAERFVEYKANRELFGIGVDKSKMADKYAKKFHKANKEDLEQIVQDENAFSGYYETLSPEDKARLAGMRRNYIKEQADVKEEEALTLEEKLQKILYGAKEQNLVYYEQSTTEDVDSEILIAIELSKYEDVYKEKEKLKGEEKAKFKKEHKKELDFYDGLKDNLNDISRYKSKMKESPEKAEYYMKKIRKEQTQAIELINDYNNE